MGEWFDIEKIDDETYAISEYGHWEKVHSYLLIGREVGLLIDTGLGIGNIRSEVNKLTDLPIKVVTTHAHWDHIGGHKLFNNIYVHCDDADWLENGLPIPLSIIRKNILAQPFTKIPPVEFNIDNYKVYTKVPTGILKDGDIIDIGLRKIRIIHTPGHSPGHICLFEEDKGYLYTGDLVYEGTLYAFYPSTNPKLFKQSIDKINKLKGVKKILPAHNNLDIEVEMLKDIRQAFGDIENKGLLEQGNGIFQFKNFRIHI